MTPQWLIGLTLALLAALVLYAVRRVSRDHAVARPFDAGAVSTRWLSEQRRDEPWTRS